MESYLDFYKKHRDPMPTITEEDNENMSTRNTLVQDEFGRLFDQAYDFQKLSIKQPIDMQNKNNQDNNDGNDKFGTRNDERKDIDLYNKQIDEDFFNENFIYDQNFIRSKTIIMTSATEGSSAINGINNSQHSQNEMSLIEIKLQQNEQNNKNKSFSNGGLYLDFNNFKRNDQNDNESDSFEQKSRLSRRVKSDVVKDSDCYEGYLEKQSPKLFVGWQTRYFVLKNRRLYYYKNDKCEPDKVKGVINFDQVQCFLKHNNSKLRFNLSMNGVGRVFKFKCKKTDDYNMWVFRLLRNIEKSEGQLLKLKIDEKISPLKSWRFDRIDEEGFLRQADIGDILLFRGTNFGSMVTRGFTQSKFDHVAMVLKFEQEKDEIFFLDATSNLGVQVTRWSRFRLFKSQVYSSVVFRHLYCERDEIFLIALEQFIRTVVGNKFSISLKKLLFTRKTMKLQKPEKLSDQSARSINHQSEQLENNDNKNGLEGRMFFCSELITKAYKEIGLFQSDKACCRFFPHDFSKNGRIKNEKLLKEAKLGEEMMLEFNEEQLKKDLEEYLKQQELDNLSESQ